MDDAGRTGRRIAVLVALVAVVAAIVVVLVSAGGGDDEGEGGAGPGGLSASARAAPRKPPLGPDAVRNATPQPDWVAYRGPVPILRWHAVGPYPAGKEFPELWIEPDDFRLQLDWLEAHGYQAVGLETVERAWSGTGTLPSKPVVLTFDGTEGDFAAIVVPDLRRRGWPGVVVLDAEAPLVERSRLRRLLATGWEVEAEGRDAAAAKRGLEAKLRTPVANFSFAREHSDAPGPEDARAAGYAGATVVGPGFATRSERYEMPRITVFGLSRVDGFAEALRSRGEGVGA